MKSRIICVVAALALTGSLLFAGDNAGSADPKTQKGKLSIWLGYPETAKSYEEAKKLFANKYPGIQVEVLTFELREFEAKLAASLPAGVGPDILALHDFIFPRYYAAGNLADVPKDLAEMAVNPKKIDQVFAKMVMRGGKVYGLPYWTGRSTLFYNKDHLTEAGLSRPPKTVKEYWDYAEKLVKKDAAGNVLRSGVSIRLTGPSGVIQKFGYLYYQMTGEQIFEIGEEIGKVRVTIKDHLDAAGQLLLDHVNHLHGAKKVDDWKVQHDGQAFAGGVTSMFLRETWIIEFTKKNGPNINFGTALMPADKAWGAFNYFEILSVNKASKMGAAAWDFVRTMLEPSICNFVLSDSGYIPLRKDVDYSSVLAVKPHHKAVMEAPASYKLYIEAPNTAYEEMTTRAGEVIQEAFRDAGLVGNLEGCKKVMMKVQDTAAAILKDNGILTAGK